jgi:hypothetical protein
MGEAGDWTVATSEGSRRRQHQEFLALPFVRKLEVIEDLAEMARFFAERREARMKRRRGAGVRPGRPVPGFSPPAPDDGRR